MSVGASVTHRDPMSPARTEELESALHRVFGSGAAPVTIVGRYPLPYRSTFPVEEIVVWVTDGGERRLVFKDFSRTDATDPGWRLKARFVHDPLREIECYRDVLSPAGISAPAYVGSAIDPRRDRYWLFLERIEGTPLWQIGDLDVWCRTARWMARLHTRFTGRTDRLPRRLLRLDAAHWRRWLSRARRLGLRRGRSSCTTRQIERLARSHEEAARWLATQPATFLHGELYPSNVLVQDHDGTPDIRVLDWEMASTGPGVLDLAALASGSWERGERAALVDSYREALPRSRRPPAAELERAVERCRLLLAVQWLGWSPRWSPPPEHEHDWLATALELAARARGGRPLAEAAT